MFDGLLAAVQGALTQDVLLKRIVSVNGVLQQERVTYEKTIKKDEKHKNDICVRLCSCRQKLRNCTLENMRLWLRGLNTVAAVLLILMAALELAGMDDKDWIDDVSERWLACFVLVLGVFMLWLETGWKAACLKRNVLVVVLAKGASNEWVQWAHCCDSGRLCLMSCLVGAVCLLGPLPFGLIVGFVVLVYGDSGALY